MAHSLDRTAVAVWRHCSGLNSIAELRRLVGADLGLSIDAKVVSAALDRLATAHLLVVEPQPDRISRRQVLRQAGRVGAIAAVTPLIASVLVPVAAAAASRPPPLPACKPLGGAELGCSSVIQSCVCSKTTTGAHVCINPSTALKRTTCKKDSDCPSGYLCIPRGKAPPRCILPCAVPTCVC